MEYLSSSFSNNGCSGLSQSQLDTEKAIHNKGAGW